LCKVVFFPKECSASEDDVEADKTELITLKYAKDPIKSNQQHQEQEQNWIPTSYLNCNDRRALEKRNELYCKNKFNSISFESAGVDYLNKLLGISVNLSQSETKTEDQL
jgi:hypothetical protein